MATDRPRDPNHPTAPTAPRRPIDRVLAPFEEFTALEASGGILLLAAAALALVWANSPWSASYFAVWQTEVRVGAAGVELAKPLILWINDGLMAVFFFVVGLEIKRELLVGELASPGKAALPIAAAIGGMVVPAGIYALINVGGEASAGWGIPMATDIAFVLGIAALLGSKVPTALKIFLTALAIVDDLGAVLVIALFYTEKISWIALGVAAALLVVLAVANRLGVRSLLVYGIVGAAVWVAVLKSGVHATVAGVLLAMTIPVRTRIPIEDFLARGRALLDRLEANVSGQPMVSHDRLASVIALEDACEKVESPLHRLEHGLHGWVSYFIMPVFALANAGVALGGGLSGLVAPAGLGVLLGLVLGKQIGVAGFSWLAVKSGVARLPGGVTWRHVYGAAWLAGIGFTMSLFIANLAFGAGELLDGSKLAILCASVVAAVGGWLVLRGAGREAIPGPATTPTTTSRATRSRGRPSSER